MWAWIILGVELGRAYGAGMAISHVVIGESFTRYLSAFRARTPSFINRLSIDLWKLVPFVSTLLSLIGVAANAGSPLRAFRIGCFRPTCVMGPSNESCASLIRNPHFAARFGSPRSAQARFAKMARIV